MPRVVYNGPGGFVLVGQYGPHCRGQVKEYPDDVALDLVQNSERHSFALDPLVQGTEPASEIETVEAFDAPTTPETKKQKRNKYA
jgi:hypothetical protein